MRRKKGRGKLFYIHVDKGGYLLHCAKKKDSIYYM